MFKFRLILNHLIWQFCSLIRLRWSPSFFNRVASTKSYKMKQRTQLKHSKKKSSTNNRETKQNKFYQKFLPVWVSSQCETLHLCRSPYCPAYVCVRNMPAKRDSSGKYSHNCLRRSVLPWANFSWFWQCRDGMKLQSWFRRICRGLNFEIW